MNTATKKPPYSVLPPRATAAIPKMRKESTVRLAVAIGQFTYKDRPACWPSQKTLMAAAGIKTDAAFRGARQELCEMRLLSYQPSAGGRVQGGKGNTSLYEWVDPQEIRPEDDKDRGNTPPPNRGVSDVPKSEEPPRSTGLNPPVRPERTPPLGHAEPPRRTVGGRRPEKASERSREEAAERENEKNALPDANASKPKNGKPWTDCNAIVADATAHMMTGGRK